MQSMKSSSDKLSRASKSNQSNKPVSTKLSPLETLINTPINSIISKSKSKSKSKSRSNSMKPSVFTSTSTGYNKSPSIKQSPLESTIKQSPLEPSINTIGNSFNPNNNSIKPPSFASKSSKFVSQSIDHTVSFFNFKNFIFTMIVIIIIAFFGINIFTYLSKGTNFITDLLGPIFSTTTNVLGDATKSVVNTTSGGTQQIIQTGANVSKDIIDITAKGTTSGINLLQDSLKKKVNVVNTENDNLLTENVNKPAKVDVEPEPIRTSSLTQGYCYTGKINDERNCAKVNEKDQCMSGDIYPTMDICINPNLRA